MPALLLAFLVFASPDPARAADAPTCEYCAELKELSAGFAKLKPDSGNHGTIEQQNELVDRATELLEGPLSQPKNLKSEDWSRILPFLATLVRFDAQNFAAEDLLRSLGKDRDLLFAEVKKAEAARTISGAAADDLRVAFARAEVRADQPRSHAPPK